MTEKKHNRLIGIFLLAHGGISTLLMLFILVMWSVLMSGEQPDQMKMPDFFFVVLIAMVLILSICFYGPQLVGGWKLLKERPNARIWGIIASVVACLSFPFGTAAGVYGLWFLFGEEGKRFYLGDVNQQPMFHQVPPPPNSWQ